MANKSIAPTPVVGHRICCIRRWPCGGSPRESANACRGFPTITPWSSIAANWRPMVRATGHSAIRWRSRSCAGSDNASRRSMPSSVKPACGGCRESACANSEDADVYLPTARGSYRLLLCRPRAVVMHPAFHSVAGKQVLRMAGERNAEMWRVWLIHSLLLQLGKWQARQYGLTTGWWHRHPSFDALQTSVSIERRFSRIFPAHLRSLARCWSRARRRFDVLLQAFRVWVSNNKFPAQRTRWKFLAGPSTESTSRPWERGTLASLRARVSRRQSGQIQTGEKQWHSTETTSR